MSTAANTPGNRSLASAAAPAEALVASARWVLVVTVLASSLAYVDGSVVNVGLVAIGRSFSADAGALQWVINAYLLPLSALLLLGGAAGDRFGRRKILLIGILIFASSSALCAASRSLDILIAGRLLQGIGAALLAPNSLAILGESFSGPAKGRAVGIWAAAGAIGGALGPVLGGWLIDLGSWRAIFLINLPLAATALALAWRFVPAHRTAERGPLDVTGALLTVCGLGALTWGLTVGSGPLGWTAAAAGSTIAGCVLFLIYLWVEKRLGEHAMTPLSLFGSGPFIALSLLTLFLYAALGELFVLLPFALIRGAGFSALAAGASLLPVPLVLAMISPLAGSVAARVGPRLVLALGSLTVAAGFALALRIDVHTSYVAAVLPSVLVIALGLAFSVAPLTTALLSSVDARYTGAASGFNSAVAEAGGLIATALLGTVLVSSGEQLIGRFHAAMLIGALGCVVASLCSLGMAKDRADANLRASSDTPRRGRGPSTDRMLP